MSSQHILNRSSDLLHFLVERLAQVEYFRGLSRATLETIALAGRIQRVPKGSILFLEGDICAGMFVLLEGQVNLYRGALQGPDMILAVMRPIIMFNEVAAIDGGPNPVTARPAQDCLLWQISFDAFQDVLRDLPEVSLGLLRVLSRRNRLLLEQCENLTLPIIKRLSRLLLDLSQDGRFPIDRRQYSLEEISGRIATAPEVVSRTLPLLRAQGGIAYDRRQIIVLSPKKLDELISVRK